MKLQELMKKIKKSKKIDLSWEKYTLKKVVSLLTKEERQQIKKISSVNGTLESIRLLPNLTKIDLPLCVAEIPKEIGKLSNLVELNLRMSEDLESLPKEIGQLSNLKVLNLEGMGIKEFPKEICQLSNLKVLVLGEIGIKEIPKEICQLSNLKVLDLSFNKLSEIPKEIFQLSKLQELYLGANEIDHLPQEIGQLKKLTRLSIHNNNLSSLPVEIGKLINLEYLDISNNLLTQLPKEICYLSKLKILDLYNNKFTKIPKETKQLPDLEDLYFEIQKTEGVVNKDIMIQPNKSKSTLETKVLNKLKKELFKLVNRMDRVFEKHQEIMDSDALAETCTEIRKGFIRDENADEREDTYSEEQCPKGYNKQEPWYFGAFNEEGNYQMGKAISIYLRNANELIKYLGETTPKFRLSVFRNQSIVSNQGNVCDDYFGFRAGELEDENGEK